MRRTIVAAAFLLGAVLTRSAPAADIPISDGTRILFIGNSFTELFGGVDSYVKAACAASKPPIKITTKRIIGWAQELSNLYANTDAVNEIKNGKWNIVVLQGFNNAQNWPPGSVESFYDSVRRFDAVIKATGGKTVLFMHWAGNPTKNWMGEAKYENDTKTLVDNYTRIGKEIGAVVVPCGLVLHDLTKNPPAKDLPKDYLYHDDIHQNALSSGINGYTFFTMLTHRSPIGMHYTLGDFKPDAAMEKAIQERVWKIIGDREPWAKAVTGAAKTDAGKAKGDQGRTVLSFRKSHPPLNLSWPSWAGLPSGTSRHPSIRIGT